MPQKRCLTIQDFSCMGRCSLTVALPTISAAGLECVAIPTTVLSNHTQFKSWAATSLTDQIIPTVDHWNDYNHSFDGIYTGYLDTDQVPLVIDVIKRLKNSQTAVLVDPAFADNGRIYPAFDQTHVAALRKLVQNADIIVPNLTEACFLVSERYPGENYDELYVRRIIQELSALGPKNVIITGVSYKEGTIGCECFDRSNYASSFYSTAAYPGKYHGTGDLFASALISSYLRGLDIETSVEVAHDLVHRAIAETMKDGLDGMIYGVEFEKALPFFVKSLDAQLRKAQD